MGVWKSKRRGWWEYKFNHQQKTYRHGGFKSRAAALNAENEKRKEVAAPPGETPSISLGELATTYLEDCQLRMQHNTVRQKAFVYRSLVAHVGRDPAVGELTRAGIGDFLKKATTTQQYNRWLRDLKALFNWGLENEHVDRSPCRGMKNLPEEPFVKYVPPAEDWNRVRLVASRDERDFIETMYYLGARRGELVRLTWEDVNFEHGRVRLLTRKRRGGALEEDFQPINAALLPILTERWKRRDKRSPYVFWFGGQQLRYMMERLCQKAEVKFFTFHAIRHRAASVINDSGKATVKDIQIFLRQRRQTTTEIYLHQLQRGAIAAAEILSSDEKWETTGDQIRGQNEEK